MPLKFPGHWFWFKTNKRTGNVYAIIVEVQDVPRDRWPTLVPVKLDPNAKVARFPFDVNENVLRFGEIEPQLVNLESYLGVFGLEEIELHHIKEKWIPDKNDEKVGMLSGHSSSRELPTYEPASIGDLTRCIVASNSTDPDIVALSHLRVGQTHFHGGRYIEAIRCFYLCLEFLYADGQFKKSATLKAFAQSTKFARAVKSVLFGRKHPSIDSLQLKYPALRDATEPSAFYTFLVNLRGDLQHATRRRPGKWHPSRQHEFEDEAVYIMAVAEAVCIDIMNENLASVR